MPRDQYDASRRNYGGVVRLIIVIILFVGFIAAIDIVSSGKPSPSPLLKLELRRKNRRNDQPFTHRHHRRTAKGNYHRRSSAPSFASPEKLANVMNNTTPEPKPPAIWTDKQIIEELLKKYRFPDSTSNISVAVLLNINRVLQADKVDELCRLQVTLTQKWTEMRLEYRQLRDTSQPIKLRSLNYIWHPALIIENALSVVPVGKDVLRVYPRGVVELTQTLQVVTEADIDFLPFPFERRNCSLTFTNDDPRAIWSRLITINLPPFDEDKEDDDDDNNFEKKRREPGHDSAEFRLVAARIGAYRMVHVELRRQPLVWVFRLFAPCIAQLFALWTLCALRHCGGVCNSRPRQPIDVIVPASVLFVTITVTIAINASQSPPTNFLKALDIWNAAVFLNALVALILVVRRNRDASRVPSACQCYELQNGEKAQLQIPYYTHFRRRRRDVRAVMHRVFVVSVGVVLLPVAFAAFFAYFFAAFVWPFYFD